MVIETLKSQKTTTPIFDGGVLRGRCCNYSISLDGLFSIELMLINKFLLVYAGG